MSYGATVAPFSPDGKRIVTAYDGRTARLWDGETGKPIGEPLNHGSVRNAAFSPDGKRVVTVSPDAQTARLWDGETGKPIGEPLIVHLNVVYIAAFSPDGKRIVTAWRPPRGAVVERRNRKANRRAAQGSSDTVLSAEFSPDGKRIVTASNDKTARLWDGETGKPIGHVKGHAGRVSERGVQPRWQAHPHHV